MAFVQSNSDGTVMNADVAFLSVPFTNPNGAGCCIVVDVIFQTAHGSGTVAVTDSNGNTYDQTILGENGSTGLWAGLFVASGCPAGANTVTITYTGTDSLNDIQMSIHEYANIVASLPIDARAAATFTTANGGNSTVSLTTGFAFDTIHAFGCSRQGCPIIPTDPAWIQRESSGVYDGLVSFDQEISSTPPTTQTLAAAFTFRGFGNISFTCLIVALKQAKQPLSPGTAWMIIGEPVFTPRPIYLGSLAKNTFTRTLGHRGSGTVPMYIPAGSSYMPQTGWQVYLYDQPPSGHVLVFAGKVDRVQLKWIGLEGDQIIELSLVSFEAYFDEILTPPQSFFAAPAGSIFTDLFNSLTGGVPVILGTVTAPFVVNVFQTNWEKLSDQFGKLAAVGAPLNEGCNWGVDLATLSVFCTPFSATAAPFQIHNSQIAFESNIWEQNQQTYRNRQIVRGSLDAFAPSAELFGFSGTFPQTFNLLRPAQNITNAWLTNNTQNTELGTFSANPADGDTVSIGYPQSGSIYNWAALGIYQVGQIIIDPANHVQKCTVAGIAGNAQPTWSDTGGTTSDGPGTPNPMGLGGVLWQDQGVSGPGGLGADIYTFVDVLDNTEWGQVLIGMTLYQTCQNLIDAINCNTAVQGQAFSWPTWENDLVNADPGNNQPTIRIRNKPAGAGYKASLFAVSTAFSWGSDSTNGGITTGGTISLQIAKSGSSNTANLYYTPGSSLVSIFSSPSTPLASRIQIQYQRAAGDCVIVEDTNAVNARAAIEGSTGKYQNLIEDTSNTSNTSLLQEARAALFALLEIPIKWSFRVWKPGLQPGDLLDLSVVDAPTGIAALIAANGPWLVYEISAELIPAQPYMDQSQVQGGGHYEYTITVINATQVSDYLDWWQGLAGSSSGSSGVLGGGAAAPLGPSGGSTGETGHIVPVVNGVAQPDLSQGAIQIVILGTGTGEGPDGTLISGPINYLLTNTPWMLIVRQTTGGMSCQLDQTAYSSNYQLASQASPAATECRQTLSTNAAGNTGPTAPPTIDQGIPA